MNWSRLNSRLDVRPGGWDEDVCVKFGVCSVLRGSTGGCQGSSHCKQNGVSDVGKQSSSLLLFELFSAAGDPEGGRLLDLILPVT